MLCTVLGKSVGEGPLRQRSPPVIARNYSSERVAHALARGH
jgi:hypothetical protein